MKNIISDNALPEQYLCAALKDFRLRNAVSDSCSKILIGHISDIHSDWSRLDNAFELFEHLKPSFVVHTGDMVMWNLEDDYSYFFEKAANASFPVFNCIGNHDTFDNSGAKDIGFIHSALISPLSADIKGAKNGFYFSDIGQIRLIVLNDYDASGDKYALSSEQLKMLSDALRGAQNDGLSVIIASHESDEKITASGGAVFCQRFSPRPWGEGKPHPHAVADIVNAFVHGGKAECSYEYPAAGKSAYVCEEFAGGGKFVCYLNGHRHGDYAGYLPSYPDQLSICMTCSGCYPEGYHNIGDEISDLPRIPGTVTENAVNMYVADLEKRTVTVVRFGAYINDLMQQRLCEVFRF